MDRYYFALKACEWAQAVVFQGERTIETANHSVILFLGMFKDDLPLASTIEYRKEYENNKFKQFMEEHFFIIALGKSIDFLKKFNEFDAVISEIYQSWGRTTIDDVRNMREHDDDFLVGNGRTRPQNFIYEDKMRSSVADATSTLIDFSKQEYLLGGRLNIFEVVSFYKRNLDKIKAISDSLIDDIIGKDVEEHGE